MLLSLLLFDPSITVTNSTATGGLGLSCTCHVTGFTSLLLLGVSVAATDLADHSIIAVSGEDSSAGLF